MRKIIYVAAIVLLGSCSKDFLNKGSQIIFDDTNFWTSENNVKSYCWEFYNRFVGFGTGTNGDFYFTTFSDDQAASGMNDFPSAAPASDGNWEYTYIRKANLLLQRAPQVPMSQEAVNHYLGVARFFRAYEYANMVRHFGDVPYINTYLDQSQTSLIYTPRTSRAIVVDSIVADLQFAAQNVRTAERSRSLGDANVLSREAVWAYLSRLALYEGTYAKYVADASSSSTGTSSTGTSSARSEKLLRIAKDAASNLVAGASAAAATTGLGASVAYTLSPVYKDVYSSLDLSKNNEVILYKSYVSGVMTHSVVGYTNSSTMMSGLTKDAVDSYLCTDGLPISLSPLYQGDDNITATLANRDRRLLQSVDDRLAYIGTPNEKGFTSSTGYKISKFDNDALTPSETLAPNNPTDAPIFWLAEVYLNYAEAAAELGELTQSDLDATVNLLRQRAGVSSLMLSAVPDDPLRDEDVSPLIWEIRRERRCELMMDGFRSWDIRRWGKLQYLDPSIKPAIFMGAKIPMTAAQTQTQTQTTAPVAASGTAASVTASGAAAYVSAAGSNGPATDAQGYILPYGAGAQRPILIPQYYLDPIPTGQQTLYLLKGIEFPQNPGW
ncbi:MAG: RagB/SusD family nutrient uptake outer membrane protein [Bacteroidales bacterium]|nr:RagB/SusD family nutrient uptake outer membrane protein [Bacteroidales bacterium]